MSKPVDQLVSAIKNGDDKTRGEAWQSAAALGAPGIQALAGLLIHSNPEVARAASRALYKIIRHAGRPGAGREAALVEKDLVKLLRDESPLVRKEAAWMLSEIGGDDCIASLAELLKDAQAREDARCALTRFPHAKATRALEAALADAPEDFRNALAESLRARGKKVKGYASRKLVPTKETAVGKAWSD